MAAKTRAPSLRKERAAEQPAWTRRVQEFALGGVVAAMVGLTLVPSESAISEGTFAPLAALACVLFLSWTAAAWLGKHAVISLGWTEIAGLALVGWHALSAILSLGTVNGRQALNALWLWVGYGIIAFVFRQGVRTGEQARALMVVMVWLAVTLANLGLYQYFYSMPALRRQYAANPEQVLAENGYPTDKNSQQRTLFENRLYSVEPLGTFALTNSLAGFLAPWLVASVCLGMGMIGDRRQRLALVATACFAVVMAACLVLTKSRTAYLATAGGLGLVAITGYAGLRSWRIDWRIPAALVAMFVVLGLCAVWLGGLDVQVLSEAPKSVLYRLEYWQATAAMIRDHWDIGAGPGNFQAAYAAYKLPQASETIGDPHNFLLEIWATVGTPGLALLLGLMVAFAYDVWQLSSRRAAETHPPTAGSSRDRARASPVAATSMPLLLGAIVGLVMAMPLAILVGYPLDGIVADLPALPVVWLIGGLLGAVCWYCFAPWIASGRLTLDCAIIPLVLLLVNLLAAGALIFPGVIGTLLVLAPLALCVARERGAGSESARPLADAGTMLAPLVNSWPRDFQLSSVAAGLLTLAAACLAVACLRTEYHPVLNAQAGLRRALSALAAGDGKAAEEAALAAAAADRYSPEAWRLLAELRLSRWLGTGREADWSAFVEAADRVRRLDSGNHAMYYSRGNWYLAAWRKRKAQEDLSEAITAYTRASMLYPNRALYHAQLAWALHLAGEEGLARQEADAALALDRQMPHQEQKLKRQQIVDPELSPSKGEGAASTAEQIVNQLRTTVMEKMP